MWFKKKKVIDKDTDPGFATDFTDYIKTNIKAHVSFFREENKVAVIIRKSDGITEKYWLSEKAFLNEVRKVVPYG